MVVVSFKNIHIWPSYGQKFWACPYLGIRFLPIGLKYFMGAQETIIYRLVMRNLSYKAYLLFLFFWPQLAGKWVLPPRAPL